MSTEHSPTDPIESVRGLAKPALRALAAEGFTDLRSLDGASWSELAALHGMGPNALVKLDAALETVGLSLAD